MSSRSGSALILVKTVHKFNIFEEARETHKLIRQGPSYDVRSRAKEGNG
jgi:hypothetical protein